MQRARLVSLNIEHSKHLDLVVPFLISKNADIVCLQEVRESDIADIAATVGARYIFAPMTRQTHEGKENVVGIAILSPLMIEKHEVAFYTGDRELPKSDTADEPTYNNKLSPMLFCDIRVRDELYRVGTTHFTWTPDGSASEEQRVHMNALLAIVGPKEDLILCGDFNAPRGGEIFGMLSSRYTDNIPPQYKTSLDLDLHRAAKDKRDELEDKMVDCLFTTPAYECSHVHLESGVSDHMAVIAEVRKKHT
ncbi:MAG: endonuclease/exonuclease/phosphatase family protein [Candidatus Paceibacterota bacterium]